MQNQEATATHTLLEAQVIYRTLDCREKIAHRLGRPVREQPRTMPHDFLVLSLRPDLTPELLPTAAPVPAQSWERNIPQK